MTTYLWIHSQQAQDLLSNPNCRPAATAPPSNALVCTDYKTAGIVLALGQPIWSFIAAEKVAFGYHSDFSPDLREFMSAHKTHKLDPRRLKQVLQHPKTTLVADCPRHLHRVSFEEAELLVSWDCPISAWGNLETQTFWCRREDLPALLALREIRRLES